MVITTIGNAAQVTLIAKYGKTGGLAGNLNNVGDTVNGRNICPSTNTNANGTPGCDMSDDPGLNDNGTPNNPDDDYYEGDMIVRTNDSFEAIAAYSWIGNAGGDEEQVTITGTLPSGTGFIWDGIPGSCLLPDSTLSADKKTVVCIKKDFDTNDVGSFAEDMAFAVKVEGDAVNGSTPGYIEFKIESPNASPVTDTTQTTNPNDEDQIVVTASPRWNIDKHRGSGYYTTQYGQTNPDTGETGWILWYNFIIEVDEVDGETDDPINPSLGNEALQGGADATVSFIDDLSQIAPNAVLATWSSSGACDMTHSNSDEPYATPNATYPDRSVSAPNGPLAITCTQSGTDVSIQVDHIDGTLTNAPIKTRTGALLPVNRKIAAIGTVKVFVPISDVEAGNDHTAGNADDGVLGTKNCVKNFTPKGISGTANFNGAEESELDNCYSYTLYAARGSWSKTYRRGWSDQADQRLEWGSDGTTNDWWYPPTDAAIVWGGDGTATPGTMWGTYTVYTNSGGTDIANPAICDVIDTETYEMVLLHEDGTDDPNTAVDDGKHAVDINYGWTETVPDIKVEYAVGYIGTWPPDPYSAAGDTVAKECNDTSITWYDTFTEASQHGAVSKARLTASTLPVEKYMAMRIKHRARSNYLTSGQPIPNKTLLVNYATYKSALTDDKYINNKYIAQDADNPHSGGWSGDRLTLQRAKVRITKDMQPTAVSPGSEPTVTLTPSFTVDGPTPQTDDVVIADLLPAGLSYKAGSTVGTYDNSINYGEPTVYSPATDAECNLYAKTLVEDGKPCGTLNGGTGKESILVWDLGQQTTGTVYGDINFTTVVTIDAPPGVLSNYVQIESPADESEPSKRIANANVSNSVPSSLLIVKSVQTPLHEVNKGSLLNWMEFSVGVRNGSADSLSELDIIDILPFNGDGTSGSFTFTPSAGTTVDRQRTPATSYNGQFEFDSMSFDENGECNAANITYWYTNVADPLDISPVASSNTDNNGAPTTIWCEGTQTGPNASCNFTNTDVTAVRIRGVDMDPSGTCYLNLKFATQDNHDNDIYSNTSGAKAVGVTNAVLSNTVSAKVYASSIGDKVWLDTNKNGAQDAGENGIDGVTVELYDTAGNLIATTTTANGGLYHFDNLIHGDYIVEVEPPVGYLVTAQNQSGNNATDSDIDQNNHRTDTITLGMDEDRTDIDAGLYTPVISGNVFDDGNGDNNVGGTPIAAPSGTQLYATLLDAQGNVLASTPIAQDGSYSFGADDGVRANSNYTVVLATTQNATVSDLPNEWNNTGENINSAGTGNDGDVNGIVSVSVGTDDVPQVDFGINHKPTADNKTEPSQLNPGGDIKVPVPALTGSDTESSNLTYVINTLPTNGTLYHADGTPVQVGDIVDPATLTVDPDDGDQIVTFTYSTIDDAGVHSDPATVTMPFTNLLISGHIFDDNDGDSQINGTPIFEADGQQLYATLLDENGNVLASMPIQQDGTYSFGNADGVQANTQYSIVLSTAENATTPDLPSAWTNVGENINSAGSGNDGTADGKITVAVGSDSIPDIDFGIVPPVHIGDKVWIEDDNDGDATTGTVTPAAGVTIKAVCNGITYTTQTDSNGNYLLGVPVNSTCTVTVETPPNTVPANGSDDSTVTDTTSENDKTHNSKGTTVTVGTTDNLSLDFGFVKTGSITGSVLEDTNKDGKGDTPIKNVTLTLYDANGVKVATTVTDANGEYHFDSLPPGDYTIKETQPSGYVDVSENEGGNDNDQPNDGVVNSIKATVSPGETDSGNDFVEKRDSGTITGTVKAIDNNGEYSPIPNVTLVLYNEQGDEVARTTTDAAGNYSFTAPPGNYYIQEQQPDDYYSVSEDEGGADDDAVHSLLNTISVKLGVTEVDIKNDFIEKKVDPYTCSVCAPKICNSCAPKAVTFTSNGTAVVTWKPTDNSVNYEIYLNGKFVASVDKDTREYRFKNLTSDTQYTVKVVAVGKYGGGLPQTFTFKTPSVGTAWMPALYYIMLP